MQNLSDDVRAQYNGAFATIRGIAEAFPENKWLESHGDVYYIPSRIAYHLAVFIDSNIAGWSKDPDFASKLPFGSWKDGNAGTLPDKKAYLAYYDEVIARAQKVLATLDDDSVTATLEPEKARFSTSQLGVHLYNMRELSAHSGELNKMLIENGIDDVWVFK
ncbi:MAG: hypothetical protein LBN43_10005 [Oscillospiraceae bacterium]|jgi:hypothetical protein|nr:hypothetical protein [Oscillospiraceae bacterium]